MKVHAVVGRRGSGKTTYIKSMLSAMQSKPLYVYDMQRQYGNHPVMSFENFVNMVSKKTDCVIVMEEATVFFRSPIISEKMQELCVSAFHHRTWIFFAFHSLRKIPLDIIDHLNYITLFKTKDTLEKIEKKFEGEDELIEGFKQIRDSQDKHSNLTIEVN